jgi:FlaA1/EpsC-like NDP-sugar epimerase
MVRYLTKGTQFVVDLFLLSAAYWVAFLLRVEFDLTLQRYKLLFFTWPYVVILKYLVLTLWSVPSFSWRYIGLEETKRILFSVSIASGILVSLRVGLAPLGGYTRFIIIPLSVLGIDFVLCFLSITGARVLRRMLSERRERQFKVTGGNSARKPTLLIGASQAGVMVAKEVVQNPHLGIDVIGFADDNRAKIGTIIQGLRVLGDTASIPLLVKRHRIEQAVITIASAPGSEIRRIVDICDKIDLPVKIIPGLYDILDGKVNLSRIRNVTIDDLLGRDAVKLDNDAIGAFLTGKRVLVTGAGGSIGSEICRQVVRFYPEKLVLIEQAENALFSIHKELAKSKGIQEIVPCVADICDSKRIDQLFSLHRPQVVFHAAAHKHVPMMEWNPGEAIKNNVFGTKKTADAAVKFGVEIFVLISTDKAVNPSSIMGASKRAAEIYVQSLSGKSGTKFAAVRFGNVLGSSGSVIPTFKEQIEKGGAVTVTHPEMKRYFMTIPESCQLVLQAAAMGEGGEIFVLDMGEPVKIVDLARDLIRLSGFSEEEIPIEFTGIRPGEKLFEELATADEKMTQTVHPKIFIGRIEARPLGEVEAGLERLSSVTDAKDSSEVRAALALLVPEMETIFRKRLVSIAHDALTFVQEQTTALS